jgi:hypothetical protein
MFGSLTQAKPHGPLCAMAVKHSYARTAKIWSVNEPTGKMSGSEILGLIDVYAVFENKAY